MGSLESLGCSGSKSYPAEGFRKADRTALALAIKKGDAEITKLLLQQKRIDVTREE